VGEFIEFPTLNDVVAPSVSLVSDNNKVTLSWDEQSAATKYLIYRSTDGKKYTKIKEVTTNTYVQTGLTYNRTYYYKVRACDISKCSNYSNVVARKIRPNKVTLTVKSAGTNNIKLGWDRVTTSGYEVYRSTNNKRWTRVKTITKNSTLEFNNKKLKSNKLYYYKVRAYKTVSGRKVYGSWSDVVYTRTAPVKPKIAVSIRNYNEINIKLSESKGANLYIIYKSTDGKNYERVYELDAPGVTVDSGNEIGKTYYYKARVCNKYNNCSPLVSASIMQTTKVPALSVSSTTTKKVSITVSPVEMADGYRVYRSSYKNSKYKMIKDVENLDELTFDNSTKKGYTYYYRVRSYKVVDGVRVYSPLSGYKKIRSK
jgi:fibronectin type 3 domain-containing protein